MTVATTPAGFPIEKSTTIGTRYANAGRICITSSTGRSVLLNGVQTAAAMPSGIPMTIEIEDCDGHQRERRHGRLAT